MLSWFKKRPAQTAADVGQMRAEIARLTKENPDFVQVLRDIDAWNEAILERLQAKYPLLPEDMEMLNPDLARMFPELSLKLIVWFQKYEPRALRDLATFPDLPDRAKYLDTLFNLK